MVNSPTDAPGIVSETRPRKNADLPVRLVSAAVMIGGVLAAFLAGGPWLVWLIWLVGIVTFVEFVMLIVGAVSNIAYRGAAILAGAVYIFLATGVLAGLDSYYFFAAVGAVVACDTGAYAAGRTFGGPKIVPRISPNKTWAGLFGGMTGAGLWLAIIVGAFHWTSGHDNWGDLIAVGRDDALGAAMVGAVLAVFAQGGDFFQSWLKRRAGVKDSSKLIPGHGGVFDRVDGLLPVALIVGIIAQVGV